MWKSLYQQLEKLQLSGFFVSLSFINYRIYEYGREIQHVLN